jgi:hypothetical protein
MYFVFIMVNSTIYICNMLFIVAKNMENLDGRMMDGKSIEAERNYP